MSTAETTIALIASAAGEDTTETRQLYDEIVRAWHRGPTGVLAALAELGVSGYAPARVAELEEAERLAEQEIERLEERVTECEYAEEQADTALAELRDELRDLIGSWTEQARNLHKIAHYDVTAEGATADQAEAEGAATAMDDAAAALARLLPKGK